jgi:hypothetical protein
MWQRFGCKFPFGFGTSESLHDDQFEIYHIVSFPQKLHGSITFISPTNPTKNGTRFINQPIKRVKEPIHKKSESVYPR